MNNTYFPKQPQFAPANMNSTWVTSLSPTTRFITNLLTLILPPMSIRRYGQRLLEAKQFQSQIYLSYNNIEFYGVKKNFFYENKCDNKNQAI